MANKMLIDASHPEETRVVVLRGNRVEEFDFEAASKRQLRGNIYLAKVTRVEPSLQAAFVDYGGNRHGFLAFSEIHPDYYQIPVADRQALLEDEARAHQALDDDDERPQQPMRRSRRHRRDRVERRRYDDEAIVETAPLAPEAIPDAPQPNFGSPYPHLDTYLSPAPASAPSHEHEHHEADAAAEQTHIDQQPIEHVTHDHHTEAHAPAHEAEPVEHSADDHHEPRAHDQSVVEAQHESFEHQHSTPHDDQDDDDEDEDNAEEAEVVEQLGGDAMEELPNRVPRLRRQYKIQEVIKRRQVLLVQVVKEERGNKGAALTTYLSLAGRYSVLMPNTARGGGISRKITDPSDRKRMKEIAQELEVPEGMGVILRTAGASRTRAEVKRDFEYLMRMWETVRELTLESSAPKLVYEEGSLIKRSIRDLYNKDIDEVIVAGEEGYREAKEFMRLLMPSHARNVVPYRDVQPIFAKSGAEQQLDAMFSNQVTLRSGGYLVINQTEALVAIDVNSGRSTREHNIEDTALRTNLEAADEVARQLRLRDLAGLIVVDFIDMEESRNNRAVERRMKEALRNDRARIQVGRISHFGLLEMSRQRMRTGVLEGSTVACPHCLGSGMVRSTSSIALHVLRVLEDALIKSAAYNITLRTRSHVALYMLNQKRGHLNDLEMRFGVTITVVCDDSLTGTDYHAIERGDIATPPPEFKRPDPSTLDALDLQDEADDDLALEDESDDEEDEDQERDQADMRDENGDGQRRRRRRRRRRGRPAQENQPYDADIAQPHDAGLDYIAQTAGDYPVHLADASVSDGETDGTEGDEFEVDEGTQNERPRRRSRRGGRFRRRDRSDYRSQRDHAEPREASDISGGYEAAPAPSYEPQQDMPASYERPVAPQWTPPPPPPPAPEPSTIASSHEHRSDDHSSHGADESKSTPAAFAQPLPEAPVDPAQPKKSGWWQKAKWLGGSDK
jgi:ribonuclease E